MPVIVPYIPSTITVHLGAPDEIAENVSVPFAEYVKNVVSSEVYPTWEPAAIRANALAVISYALNRVYTEYYRSRGYDFDITNTTARDQKFIRGRNIYENVSELVDDVFNDYIRSPPNSATARPPPAKASASGAHSIRRSRAQTALKSSAVTMVMTLNWSPTHLWKTHGNLIPAHRFVLATQAKTSSSSSVLWSASDAIILPSGKWKSRAILI